ncbi:MAG: HAMP domain-containing histidine kinase [Streptococcaceae bacterium]|jgi:signal transduction histidine kinase|nr:HAMP domain-containing histidine kinase [Streptococcaceae bacterium]
MIIRKKEIENLSMAIRKLIDGQEIDIRCNQEGAWPILKNDIHILAGQNKEQIQFLQQERDILKHTLADISHQIKTPLTSMSIMLDLVEGAPSEKQVELLKNMRASLDQTQWLVEALLKIAKLESGSISFSKKEHPVESLVQTAILPLAIQLEIKEQTISYQLKEDLTIFCDARWTSEALGNIIKNASEHSPKDSQIVIVTGENPIAAWIKVQDCGDGLTNEQIAKLFRRFEASNSSAGYGIGLPLAKSIMKSQKGDIEVDGGGNGQGATFTLKFYKMVEND